MRLRHTLSATLGALALIVCLPTSASAATGDFSYKFVGLDGTPQSVTLHDPESPGCIILPEVADPDSSEPAFAPHNDTDEWVMVFTEPDCTGDSWTLRPHGNPTTDRLTLRSVFLTGRH
uniref:Secreted protein n=1 Tax=Streptomyces sp. NBC_00180 TaxID=2903632 RepID=A0AAU1I9H5_9ACTN